MFFLCIWNTPKKISGSYAISNWKEIYIGNCFNLLTSPFVLYDIYNKEFEIHELFVSTYYTHGRSRLGTVSTASRAEQLAGTVCCRAPGGTEYTTLLLLLLCASC